MQKKKIIAAAACAAMALALAFAPAADAAGSAASREGELKIAPKALKVDRKHAGSQQKAPRPKGPAVVIYDAGSRAHRQGSAKRMQAEQERALRMLERNIARKKEIERRDADRRARAEGRIARGRRGKTTASAKPSQHVLSAQPLDASMEDPDVLAAQSIVEEARGGKAQKPGRPGSAAKAEAAERKDRTVRHEEGTARTEKPARAERPAAHAEKAKAGKAKPAAHAEAKPAGKPAEKPAASAGRHGAPVQTAGAAKPAAKPAQEAKPEVKRVKNRIEPGDVHAVAKDKDAGKPKAQAAASAPAAKPAPAPAAKPAPAAAAEAKPAPKAGTAAAPAPAAKPAAPSRAESAPAPETPVHAAGGAVRQSGESDGLPLPRETTDAGGDLGGPVPASAGAPQAGHGRQEHQDLEKTFQQELEKTLRDAGASLHRTLRYAGDSISGVLQTGRTIKIPGGERRAQLLLREWRGGKPMPKRELRETLRAVTKVLTPDGRWCSDAVAALLMETAAVETDLGEIVRQKGGPALSPWQLLNMNYRELPRWFAKRDPELYRRAMTLYDHSKPAEWNKVHNVPWTAAMCLLHYEQATKGRFMSCLGSLDERASLWKRSYNTYLGAGTVAGYKKKARRHVYGGRS